MFGTSDEYQAQIQALTDTIEGQQIRLHDQHRVLNVVSKTNERMAEQIRSLEAQVAEQGRRLAAIRSLA